MALPLKNSFHLFHHFFASKCYRFPTSFVTTSFYMHSLQHQLHIIALSCLHDSDNGGQCLWNECQHSHFSPGCIREDDNTGPLLGDCCHSITGSSCTKTFIARSLLVVFIFKKIQSYRYRINQESTALSALDEADDHMKYFFPHGSESESARNIAWSLLSTPPRVLCIDSVFLFLYILF